MTRETRIGLLVGVGFVIMFGLVLGSLNESSEPPQAVRLAEDTSFHEWTRVRTLPRVSARRVQLTARSRQAGEARRAPAASGEFSQPGVVEASWLPLSAEGQGQAVVRSEMHRPGPSQPRTYTVQPNDSLCKIAKTLYGDESQYPRILEANRQAIPDENTLRVGQTLIIPSLPVSSPCPRPMRATEPQSGPSTRNYRELEARELPRFFAQVAGRQHTGGRTYVVRPGDNLTGIARRLLNDDSKAGVRKIYSANRNKLQSPDCLPVGLELTIPG